MISNKDAAQINAPKAMEQRVFGLDLARTIAIILVLIAHTFSLFTENPALKSFYSYCGIVGVELFFVLSGFLIGGILLRVYTSAPTIDFKIIKSFWIRRWFRTLPNYYLVLLFFNLVYYRSYHGFVFSPQHNFDYFFFAENLFKPMPDSAYGVFWSLSVEEWFYLLFPLCLWAISIFTKKKQLAFLTSILLFILLPLFFRITASSISSINIPWDQGYRKIVFFRLDSIGTGVLLAYLHHYYQNFLSKHIRTIGVTGLILFGLVTLSYYLSFNNALYKQTAFFSLQSVSMLFILYFLSKKTISNVNIQNIVRNISLISYSIYLLHLLIVLLMYIVTTKFKLDINHNLYIAIVWVATLAISFIQYSVFEKRMTNLRERFT